MDIAGLKDQHICKRYLNSSQSRPERETTESIVRVGTQKMEQRFLEIAYNI